LGGLFAIPTVAEAVGIVLCADGRCPFLTLARWPGGPSAKAMPKAKSKEVPGENKSAKENNYLGRVLLREAGQVFVIKY
jgi:hypothetical protein